MFCSHPPNVDDDEDVVCCVSATDSVHVEVPLMEDEAPSYFSQQPQLMHCRPEYFTRNSEMTSAYVGAAIMMLMAVFTRYNPGLPNPPPSLPVLCCVVSLPPLSDFVNSALNHCSTKSPRF